MRVGSGRRMRSRRRVGRLPPTMSRRTFEVLDGLVVVVIANATTTLSGVLIPPWRHRAQEIGAKLRLRLLGPVELEGGFAVRKEPLCRRLALAASSVLTVRPVWDARGGGTLLGDCVTAAIGVV